MYNNDYKLDSNIIHSIYYIGHKCLNIAEEKMKPYNVSFPQSVILHILFSSNSDNLCPKDIVDILGIRGASVTSILNTMSKKGLIVRTRCSNDARKIIIKGTDKGREIYGKIRCNFEAGNTHIFDNLTREEKETLLNILLKIT